jgi:hypothetical protein
LKPIEEIQTRERFMQLLKPVEENIQGTDSWCKSETMLSSWTRAARDSSCNWGEKNQASRNSPYNEINLHWPYVSDHHF